MYRVSRVDNALKKHDRAWLRASPLKSGRSGTRDKEKGEGGRKIPWPRRRVAAEGEEKIELNRPELRVGEATARRRAATVLRFGRAAEGMAETTRDVYTARGRCDANSIPLVGR